MKRSSNFGLSCKRECSNRVQMETYFQTQKLKHLRNHSIELITRRHVQGKSLYLWGTEATTVRKASQVFISITLLFFADGQKEKILKIYKKENSRMACRPKQSKSFSLGGSVITMNYPKFEGALSCQASISGSKDECLHLEKSSNFMIRTRILKNKPECNKFVSSMSSLNNYEIKKYSFLKDPA